MPTIPQEIDQSTQSLVDNTTIVEAFAQGAATEFIPVRGGTLRPLLYWQGTFQSKVEQLAQPYIDQLVAANQVADSKVQAASESASDADQSAQAAAASAASVDFPARLAEINERATRLARSLAVLGDHGQSMHIDFVRKAFALGDFDGLNRTLSFAELFPDYARLSPATYWDANGVMRTAGINEPRFNHDPVTGAARGYLGEGRAENKALHSEQFDNPVWAKFNCIIVPSSEIAPNGELTAYKLVESLDSSNQFHYARQLFPVPDNTQVAYSIHAKAAERSWAYFEVLGKAGEFVLGGVWVDLLTGNVTGGGGSVTTQQLANGWWRILMTVNLGAGTSTTPWVGIQAAQDLNVRNYIGDGTSGIHIWGAQFEEGTQHTSYIKTLDMPVTRAADNLGRMLDSEYNQHGGTWVVDVSSNGPSGLNQNILTVHDGSGENRQRAYINPAQTSVTVYGVAEGAVMNSGNLSISAPNSLRVAMSMADDNFGLCVNGGEVLTDTDYNVPLSDRVTFGAGWSNQDLLFGHIRSIIYIPRPRFGAVLQEITA